MDQYLIVGSMGGRLDHHFSNVATLFKAASLTTRPVYLISDGNLACLLPRVSIGSICILSQPFFMFTDDHLYTAILRFLGQTRCAPMWFYMSDYLFIAHLLKINIHQSRVLTVLAWLVPHETAAVLVQIL